VEVISIRVTNADKTSRKNTNEKRLLEKNKNQIHTKKLKTVIV